MMKRMTKNDIFNNLLELINRPCTAYGKYEALTMKHESTILLLYPRNKVSCWSIRVATVKRCTETASLTIVMISIFWSLNEYSDSDRFGLGYYAHLLTNLRQLVPINCHKWVWHNLWHQKKSTYMDTCISDVINFYRHLNFYRH